MYSIPHRSPLLHAVWSAIAVCLLLVSVFPAQAQQNRSNAARLASVSTAYGDCVVGRYPADAQHVVLADLSNDQIGDDFRRLNNVTCMGNASDEEVGGIRFRADSFRYMLAEALVRLHYAASGPSDFSAVPPIVRPPVEPLDEAAIAEMNERRQEAARENHRQAVGLRIMSLIGECVVRQQAEGVRALALSEPYSAAESNSFGAIQPAIASCLPTGETVRLNRTVMRGVLLLNYYRLAHAVQPVEVPARS